MLPIEYSKEIYNIINHFDKLFNDTIIIRFPELNKLFNGDINKIKYPKMCMTETSSDLIIEFGVPGLSKKDIKIQIKDEQFLTISYEKDESIKEHGDDAVIIFNELKRSKFYRGIPLNSDLLDLNKITAKCENGLLKISVPKINKIEKQRHLIKDVEIN